MAFIVKGGVKEISKAEMAKHMKNLYKKDDALACLSDAKKQIRK